MKKQNKILEEIYTVRTITAFSVFCALFVALLFVLKIDDLELYIASKSIMIASLFITAVGAALWIFGKIRKEPLRAFTLAFIGQLVFFSAFSAVLFAILVKEGVATDSFGVLLAYGILCIALYTVYASARDSFSHALATGIGVAVLYVLRHFQGGGKFYPILAAVCVIFIGFALLMLLRKKEPKSELFAICAASLFNIVAAVLFAFEPPLFLWLIGGEVALYFVTRLFVKL